MINVSLCTFLVKVNVLCTFLVSVSIEYILGKLVSTIVYFLFEFSVVPFTLTETVQPVSFPCPTPHMHVHHICMHVHHICMHVHHICMHVHHICMHVHHICMHVHHICMYQACLYIHRYCFKSTDPLDLLLPW